MLSASSARALASWDVEVRHVVSDDLADVGRLEGRQVDDLRVAGDLGEVARELHHEGGPTCGRSVVGHEKRRGCGVRGECRGCRVGPGKPDLRTLPGHLRREGRHQRATPGAFRPPDDDGGLAATHGAWGVRVHDVRASVDAIKVVEAWGASD